MSSSIALGLVLSTCIQGFSGVGGRGVGCATCTDPPPRASLPRDLRDTPAPYPIHIIPLFLTKLVTRIPREILFPTMPRVLVRDCQLPLPLLPVPPHAQVPNTTCSTRRRPPWTRRLKVAVAQPDTPSLTQTPCSLGRAVQHTLNPSCNVSLGSDCAFLVSEHTVCRGAELGSRSNVSKHKYLVEAVPTITVQPRMSSKQFSQAASQGLIQSCTQSFTQFARNQYRSGERACPTHVGALGGYEVDRSRR